VYELILSAYVLLGATGFAGLACLAFLRIRSRRPIVGLVAGAIALLLAGLSLNVVSFYSSRTAFRAGPSGGTELLPLGIAQAAIQGGIYLFVFLAIGKLGRQAGFRRALRTAARALCLANVIMPAASVFLAADALFREAPIPRSFLGLWGYALTATAVAASGLFFLLAPASEEPPSVRFLLRGFGVCCLAFLPLTALEALLETSGAWPFRPVSLDFLFYFGLNVSSCLALGRSLAADSGPAFAGPSEEAAASLGLTERERAMASMIGRGLSNKEIAAELGISPATVRTHIYNLYRKAGARSRVELLNILSRK